MEKPQRSLIRSDRGSRISASPLESDDREKLRHNKSGDLQCRYVSPRLGSAVSARVKPPSEVWQDMIAAISSAPYLIGMPRGAQDHACAGAMPAFSRSTSSSA
jgi:hypothetical protein